MSDTRETAEIDVELTDSSPASRLDHYQLLTQEDGTPLELGRGAMGMTYKAIDINLRCAVALKVISARFVGDESARRRFVREAQAAASVRHPNVASVFHLGKSGDEYFYAMEFVEGETLEILIKRSGRLEPKIALEITSQVAAGLAAIHEQKLVHRDIKPTNIMVKLTDGGLLTAKIIDLGLAKPITDASSGVAISTPGAFAGTPEFASPEQFAGVPVDIRSDLYSLGVTLWEMLTGNAPFRGTPGEVMHQHQHAPLPLERLEDVPQPFVALLEVLLQKDPSRRFQDPTEFLKAIPALTGAIDARRMRTIRVFVSSPGDVQKERKLADNLIRSVAAEFGVPVSVTYSNLLRSDEIFSTARASDDGTLVLCPYFWEYQRFRSVEGYQEQIPNPAEFDLVICILWSRLGTQLAPKFVLPDGSPPQSGTDYEIAWALYQSNQTRGVPALHVYRNRSTPNFPLEPEDRYKELVDQWRSLKDFFARWEKSSEGHFVGAFNNYLTLDEFEDLFRTHFRDYLLSQLDRGTSHRMLDGKTKRWLENPFRGLEVFEFEHAPIFRGRTKAVGELLDLLIRLGDIRKPFVLVIGASGSGKSSFVRAGVLPFLTEPGIVEGIGLWRRAVARPAAAGAAGDPFDALAAALLNPAALPELADQEAASPVTELADELRENPAGVALRVKDALRTVALRWKDRQEQFLRTREEEMKAANRPEDADSARQRREQLSEPRARLALVVDQLEELFTTGFSPEIQGKYVSAVSGLARSGRVFIIATLRSDFYARYQEFPELVELAKEGRFDLRPPAAGELRAIIQQPAEAAGLSFERDPESGESLDEALRDAAIKNPESLPLLQHALDQLFQAQTERQDNLLRWYDYRALGGVEGALAKHAETTFEKLHPHEQGAFPVVMRQLVTLGQGGEEVPNRRNALYSDFSAVEAEGQSRAGAQAFIDLFVKNRLLMADMDTSGNVVISVTHEALLRHWTRVLEWLAVNREFLRMRDRLDANLQIWKGRGRQKADLLQSGLPLAEGEKLLTDFAPSLGPEQSDYIRASIAESLQQQRQRQQLVVVTFIVIALLAVGAAAFAIFGFWQKSEAEKAASRAYVLLARNSDSSGKDAQALAYLAQALRLNHRNYEAAALTGALLTQTTWPLPVADLMGHRDTVYSAEFSPDGQRVVTASFDNTARLWDAASGKPLGEPLRHEGKVFSVRFSPDGQRVVTASIDNTARLWDAASGKPLGEPMRHERPVFSARFSPDGQRVVTASSDGTARLWDAASGKPLGEPMQHESSVYSAEFSPDGQRVVTASFDNAAQLWDAASGKPLGEPMRHERPVSSAQFSPDGQRVLTASWDGTARLWDAASGKPLGEPMRHEDKVYSARFSPDGQWVVTASDDKTARLWDAASGKPLGEPMRHEGPVESAEFSPDCQRVVTACEDKTARLWDAASGKPLGEPLRHELPVSSAQFSPDGQRVVTTSEDKTARLWNAVMGRALGEPLQYKGPITSVDISPDGQRVLTASIDKTARLWDAASGKPLGEPMRHELPVYSAQFSPDGRRVLTTSEDNTARLWDAASGRPLGEPMRHELPVSFAQFSPDGQRVVTASIDYTVRLWDAPTICSGDASEDEKILLLANLAEANGCVAVRTSGQAEILSFLTSDQVRATRGRIAATFQAPSSTLTPLQRFLKWDVSEPGSRTISPFSELTIAEWVSDRIKQGTVDGLRSAMQVDPANPRLAAHLGKALAKYALEPGLPPDEARRARAEADFQTRRALTLAPNNDEVKKLRMEVLGSP